MSKQSLVKKKKPPSFTPFKNDKKKKKRPPGSNRIYICLAILATIITTIVSFNTFLFPLETIAITSDGGVSEGELQNASKLEIGTNMFHLNLKAAEKNILDQFPAIDDVKIKTRALQRTAYISAHKSEPMLSLIYYKSAESTMAVNYYTVSTLWRITGASKKKSGIVVYGLPTEDMMIGDFLFSSSDANSQLSVIKSI